MLKIAYHDEEQLERSREVIESRNPLNQETGSGGTEKGMMTGLEDLRRRLEDFRDRRDWKRFHKPKDLALSISIETAELLELFQWKSDADIAAMAGSAEFREKASDEIADILIYLVLLAGELEIDPLQAAGDKIGRNETRFPAEQSTHGGARQ